MSIPQLLDDYFALYVSCDAGRHLQALHPQTLTLDGRSAAPAAQADPEAFALRLAQGDTDRAQAPVVGYVLEQVEELGDRALARLRLTLSTEPGTLRVAACLSRVEGCYRVAAIALDPSGDLAYAHVEALSAAEFASLPPHVERYVTGLDLAYARLYSESDEWVEALPEARFTCHMSGKCCTGALGIGVGETARRAFERVDWPEVVAVSLPDPYLIPPDDAKLPHRMATKGDRCVFLDAGQCSIHSALGTPFNPTCVTFPISFVVTPDGPQATGSFTCPSVRANRGERLQDRQADLRQRRWLWGSEAAVIGEQVPFRQGKGAISWSLYRELERGWLESFADEPVPEALGRGLFALRSLGDPEGWTLDTIQQGLRETNVPRPALPGFKGVELLGAMLYGFLSQYQPEALIGDRQPPAGFEFALHVFLPSAGVTYRPEPEVLRRYLRETLYRKRWLMELGVVETYHFVLLSAAFLRCYAEFLAFHEGRKETSRSDFDRAVEAMETACHHSPGFSRLLGADPSIRACLASASFADGWLALVQR